MNQTSACPRYLTDYAALWQQDPHAANLAWFAEARFGLFIHYGPSAQLGRGEWAMFHERIPPDEYERLFDTFNPSAFDADFITDLACEAGMRYVNMVSCHHDGFCLYDSQVEACNSMRYVGRDLIAEMAEQCERKGLGFFTYFTHALNWRHPYAISPDLIRSGRPHYEDLPDMYQFKEAADWRYFWDWSQACIKELCERTQPLAGMWLDLIAAYYTRPDLMPIEETYALIRETRPEALISFKQGATGTEDFASPEFHFKSLAERFRNQDMPVGADIAERAWQANREKHNEICMTLQTKGWGYHSDAGHKSPDEILENLAYAAQHRCNLLTNIGSLPDGSVHPEDVACLKTVGQQIRRHGWPTAGLEHEPQPTSGAADA